VLDTKGNQLTYFGHSTFSLTTPSGQVGLIDPFISDNPRCPESLKKVPRVDVIFLSHAHSDHLGDTLKLAKQHHPQIVAIFETCLWIQSKGFEKETRPMGKGGTQHVGEFEVTLTHAFHSNSIHDGKEVIYAGEPAGLIIRLPGGFTIYHAGDTCAFNEMKMLGEFYKPDLALLPIGDHFTMGPREAAHAIGLLGVKHVVPMHYATFPVLTGTPDAFRKEASNISGLQVHELKPGESL
jgi:L-ascorbate metabolism protein UlaG (beta-lactamase superfamily)